ncbi:hypothetical protein CDV36_016315, partial [Fusarium kuroshium]
MDWVMAGARSLLSAANERVSPTRSPSSFSFFLIKTSLQSNILMADSIPLPK